jgi:glycosyltransferase involved in cell wall biosynthesis
MDAKHFPATSVVSIVMRTVGGRPREIRRALSSVLANTWRPLEVVVVYQGAEDAQWADLQALSGEFPALPLRILRNPNAGDRRAENLNIGWEAAQGRFIGFLDDDDALEPNHVALLVQAIQSSGHAWAFAQVVLRKEDEALNIVGDSRPFRRHTFSLKSLWAENFLPIHSFLIDRTVLNEAICVRPFCEDLDRSEDWDFLLRLAFYHEPSVVEEFTAYYHVSTGARNTNLSLMNVTGDEERERCNREAWARCKSIVEKRKDALVRSIWWASAYWAPELSPALQQASVGPPVRRPLRVRAVRKLIRILERLL